jgi:hypothetical protein
MTGNRSMMMADYEKNDSRGNHAEPIDWEENEDRRVAREKSLWQVSQSIATLNHPLEVTAYI